MLRKLIELNAFRIQMTKNEILHFENFTKLCAVHKKAPEYLDLYLPKITSM